MGFSCVRFSQVVAGEKNDYCVVVTGTFYCICFHWEFHHPNWRVVIFFQRGRSTTNQIMIDYGYIFISNPTESGGFRYIIHLYPRNGMMIPTDSSICFRGWNHQILSSFVEKLVIYSNWNMLFDGFWCNNGILPDTAWYCMPGIERNSEWIQPIMAFFKIWNMGRTHRIYGNVNQCKPTGF